jgi:hypothetical protein
MEQPSIRTTAGQAIKAADRNTLPTILIISDLLARYRSILTFIASHLGCLNISLSPGALDAKPYRDFYLRYGLNVKTTGIVTTRGYEYLKMVTGLPPTFRRLVHGDELVLGGRRFRVLTGDGPAPEQIMLHCPEEKIFLAADQVLAKNIAQCHVWAVEPEGDPLQLKWCLAINFRFMDCTRDR